MKYRMLKAGARLKTNKVILFTLAIIISLVLVVPFVYQFAYHNFEQYNIVTYGDAKRWIEQNQNDLDLIIKYAREKGGSLYYDIASENGKIRNYRATDEKKLDYLSEEECQSLKKAAKRLKVRGVYEVFSEDDEPFLFIEFSFIEKFMDTSSNHHIFYVPEENVAEMFNEEAIRQISDEEWDNKVPDHSWVVKIMNNWYLENFLHI